MWCLEDFHYHLAGLRRAGLKPVEEHGRANMRLMFRWSLWATMTWNAIEAWKKAKEANYGSVAADPEVDLLIAEGAGFTGVLSDFRNAMLHLQPDGRFSSKWKGLMLNDAVDAWGLRLMGAFQAHVGRYPSPPPAATRA